MSTKDTKPVITSILLVSAVMALVALFVLITNVLPSKVSEEVAVKPNTTVPVSEGQTDKNDVAVTEAKNSNGTEVANSKTVVLEAATAEISPSLAATQTAKDNADTQTTSLDLTEKQIVDNTLQSDASNDTNTAISVSSRIEVPKSFSLRDADKYFIPKEERTPGNLGGPPPFPEGMLNVFGQNSNSEFAPPPAPGSEQ